MSSWNDAVVQFVSALKCPSQNGLVESTPFVVKVAMGAVVLASSAPIVYETKLFFLKRTDRVRLLS